MKIDIAEEDLEFLRFMIDMKSAELKDRLDSTKQIADASYARYGFSSEVVEADKAVIDAYKTTMNILDRIGDALDNAEED